MLNIKTNATPQLLITLCKKNSKEIIHETTINLTDKEMKRLFDCLKETSRYSWEEACEIKAIIQFVSSRFDINNFSETDLSIMFPESFIQLERSAQAYSDESYSPFYENN